MNKKSGIYCITNLINNMKYIGQSVNLDRRERQHFNKCNSNKYLQNAMKKYGKINFIWEVLEYCSVDSLTEREQYYINLFDFKNLYNLCPIAKSQQGLCRVPVLQINIKTKEVIKRWDSMQKAADAFNIKPSSISSVCSDKPILNKKTNKYHIRKSCQGYFWKYDNNTSIIIPPQNILAEESKKPVAQIDINTLAILRIYNSVSEASYQTKCNATHISSACKNRRKTCGGYCWKLTINLTEEQISSNLQLDISQLQRKQENNRSTHKIFCINRITKEEFLFENASEASFNLNVSYTHLLSVINNKRNHTGNFHFYYAFI